MRSRTILSSLPRSALALIGSAWGTTTTLRDDDGGHATAGATTPPSRSTAHRPRTSQQVWSSYSPTRLVKNEILIGQSVRNRARRRCGW